VTQAAYDGTVEGLDYPELSDLAQFHPEARPRNRRSLEHRRASAMS